MTSNPQTSPYLEKILPGPGEPELEGNNQYDGYCYDVTAMIAEIVGFEYLIQPVKDGKYGAPDENGTWNGMVGELIRNVGLTIAYYTIAL